MRCLTLIKIYLNEIYTKVCMIRMSLMRSMSSSFCPNGSPIMLKYLFLSPWIPNILGGQQQFNTNKLVSPNRTIALAQCLSIVEMNSLKTNLGYQSEIKFKNIRTDGVQVLLNFYDSHCNDKNKRYHQSSMPTVLMLPSGDKQISNYEALIGDLVEKNIRVLAVEFPGFGGSTLKQQDSSYVASVSQKACIIHDFIQFILPNRKKYLNRLYIMFLKASNT